MSYTDHESIALVQHRLERLFPRDVTTLMRLCMLDFPIPLGFKHIDAWLEALGVVLEEDVLEDLRIGYVLLSAYYFLLDAVADGHLENREDVLFLSHLLTGTWILWHKACLQAAPDKMQQFHDTIFHHTARNASAVMLETALHEHPLTLAEQQDYDSIIGRSDSAIMLYDVLCIICNREQDPRLVTLLSDAVYYIQLGDDLADWRKDYRAGRWTSFLRTAFARLGTVVSEQETEEVIYFDGLFEQRLAIMVNGYLDLLDRLRNAEFPTALLQRWIEYEYHKVLGCLTDAVSVKLSVSR